MPKQALGVSDNNFSFPYFAKHSSIFHNFALRTKKTTMKHLLLIFSALQIGIASFAQSIVYKTQPATGAIAEMRISGDKSGTNWILKADKSQYPWVTEKYGWGLGYLTVNGTKEEWEKPTSALSAKTGDVTYKAGDITVSVERKALGDGFEESYTFTNNGSGKARLADMGIYTPFNDNYPNAELCMKARCHAHIWAGESAAYVELLRMSGQGDGIGLMVTEGKITDYDVWERGMEKDYSNFRGVIALCPADTVLDAGRSMTVAWRLFRHEGTKDFYQKLVDYGGAVVSSPKYVYQVGETAKVVLATKAGKVNMKVKITKPGEVTVGFDYGDGKETFARLLGVSSYEGLIEKRVNFILDHQQLHDANDPRNGAFMVYDNETDKIYKNDDGRRSGDTDEGRERVGMGILLAKWYKLHPSDRIKDALTSYAKFVRTRLQRPDYNVYNSALDKNVSRGYNHPWVADFYFRMYDITGDKQYAYDGYATMRAFFRTKGYGFYAIEIPVLESLSALKKAGMAAERDSLLDDYKKTAAKFMAVGLNFPKSEVNYEQSIMAPATQFMAQMYLAVRDKAYLDCTKMMMKPLESFTAFQPSYHLNEIAIRHWDGYWFGKRQLYGDTFPHYWSTENATTYHYYSKCTGDRSYQKRAENIVRNNLCLFFEDGRASCAYLYPRRINGEKAHYYDAFANDQDWALVNYLTVNCGI